MQYLQPLIPIPEDKVLIDKSIYNELVNNNLDQPAVGDKKWLKSKTGLTSDLTLYRQLLDPFRDELDMENGGPVHYSAKQGERLMVMKKPFNKWLDENYERVYGNEK